MPKKEKQPQFIHKVCKWNSSNNLDHTGLQVEYGNMNLGQKS